MDPRDCRYPGHARSASTQGATSLFDILIIPAGDDLMRDVRFGASTLILNDADGRIVLGLLFGRVWPKPDRPLRKSNGDKQPFVQADCHRQPLTQSGSSPDHRLVPRKAVVMVPWLWHSADVSCCFLMRTDAPA
jgi:hypothetical protein